MASEKLEVYTPDGKPTGKAKLRSQVHKDGDWHNTVHVWIAQPDGHVLIQRRSKQKTEYPYLWDASSAGHVCFGETSKQAAIKECYEELGIQIEEDALELLFTAPIKTILNEGKVINAEFIDVYLVIMNVDLSKLKLQESEVCDAKLIHWSQLETLYKQRDKRFVAGISLTEEYMKLFDIFRKKFGNTKPKTTDLSFLD